MNQIMIKTNQLCRSFGKKQAIDGVSLSISRGTVCSLLGPNGAGKTTLLKLLHGLILPTSGSCAIVGDDQFPRGSKAMQTVGCLIDEVEPPDKTTIKQLLAFSHSVGPRFDRQRAMKMLSDRDISLNANWKSLSKGQKRWAMLSLVLCRGCDVLLLDEPADGLDPAARSELYQLIRREANDRSVTTLVTTHIINDIEKVTDDVCILFQGKLILDEQLEDLREQILVLEIENLPPLNLVDPRLENIQVLRQEQHQTTTVWVRDVKGCLEQGPIPGEISRRRINLEQMFLAITTEAGDRLAKPNDQPAKL